MRSPSNAGAKLRLLDNAEIKKFPSNGFVALEDFLANNRQQAVALARGYAKGTVFAIANPEAAIRILWEVYPQTKATGKDEATALRDDLLTLGRARQELALRAGRRQALGRQCRGELSGLSRLAAGARHPQGQDRRE